MFQSPDIAHFPFTEPPGWDFGLPAAYAVWVFVVVSLCPLCRWYERHLDFFGDDHRNREPVKAAGQEKKVVS